MVFHHLCIMHESLSHQHVLVYEATIPAEANGEWHMDDTPFNVESGDEYFYLTFDEDYLGDFLIDQVSEPFVLTTH